MNNLHTGGSIGYLRIATEEAFAPPEMMKLYEEMLDSPNPDPGFERVMGYYLHNKSPRAVEALRRLQDLGAERIANMDALGIDHQVIGLTAPGTQILSKDRATALSELANDQLAEACRRYPGRFAGMAACAPQDPLHSAREIERAVTKLGMRAVVINSHTHGEYLSDPKFWPILEAIEQLDVPLYLHPQSPPRDMIKPMLEARLDGAIFGFGVEAGFHALWMITSGVFDRFPRLQVILGHMGEALPFWIYRLDSVHAGAVRSGSAMKTLKRGFVSNYLKSNFHITSSGVAWEPAIRFTQEQIGVDRVLYAMDYPYRCSPEEVAALDAMNMDIETKKKFFQTNAERLFRI